MRHRSITAARAALALACLGVAACGEVEPGSPAPARGGTVQDEVGTLSPIQRLIRASVSLRGVRPEPAELTVIADHPELLGAFVDSYLEDPRFGTVIRDLHNETLFLTDPLLDVPATGPLAGEEANRLRTSLQESPLRLIEDVVTTDRPYIEIVTADYAVANDVVARAWVGLEGYAFDDPSEWQVVRWSDGRPAAGILSDSGLWSRNRSPNRNFNRRRANYVSRALLCTDFLDSDIAIDASADLANPEDTTPLTQNVVCASCHVYLDPLASFLPFREDWTAAQTDWPMELYTKHGAYWDDLSGQPPGYFGTPGDDLADLGRLIAADPRFAACTARRFYSYFAQVPLDQVDDGIVDALGAALVDSGWSAKALARAVILDPTMAEAEVKRTRPEAMASVIEALTGYRWQTWNPEACCGPNGAPLGATDLLRDDLVGYRTLFGGIDSYAKLEPTHTTNATSAVVLRRLGADAASAVVDHDLGSSEPRLLTLVDADTSDEAGIRAQLVALHWQLYGERLSASDVDDDWALWSTSFRASGAVDHAWKTTMTALLTDFDLAFY